MASNSKKKPPTTSSDGHESRRWREGTATLQNAEIRAPLRPLRLREEHQHAPLLLHAPQRLAVAAHDEANTITGDRVPREIPSGSFHVDGHRSHPLLLDEVDVVDGVVALLLRAVERDRESMLIKLDVGSRDARDLSLRRAAPS